MAGFSRVLCAVPAISLVGLVAARLEAVTLNGRSAPLLTARSRCAAGAADAATRGQTCQRSSMRADWLPPRRQAHGQGTPSEAPFAPDRLLSDLRARRRRVASPHPRNGEGTLLACPQTVHPRPRRRGGRAAPRSAPGGSAAGPAAALQRADRPRPSTISRTRRTACGSPCAGVSAPSWASATSLRCSSSAATRSRTRRSAPGRSASRRGSRTRCERSGAARPAAPGTSTRPPGRSPGAGALATAPSTARGCSSTPGAARTAPDKHAARRFLRRLVEVAERKPAARHHGPASAVPQSDPLDPGTEGRAPDESIPQQPHGTGPPRGAAALLPDARFRELRLSGTLLLGV